MLRSARATLTKQTMGRIRRRTSAKATFNHVRRAHFLPQVRGQIKEAQQFGQIALQPPHPGQFFYKMLEIAG
jgi:hypothetical protein